jgi:hypothetical protein
MDTNTFRVALPFTLVFLLFIEGYRPMFEMITVTEQACLPGNVMRCGIPGRREAAGTR